MWLVVAAGIVLAILIFAEYLARYKGLHSELSRKLVHISVGTFAAFWPFFLSWGQIQLLGFVFLGAMLVSVKFHLFRSVHGVERTAAGEILAAVAILILSFITSDPWVFAAAMLHVSIADGLAATVGVLWGDNNTYKVFGHTRSVVGSLAFFFSSVVIMIIYAAYSGDYYSSVTLLWLPVLATLAENVSVKGSDNIVIPLLVVLLLTTA